MLATQNPSLKEKAFQELASIKPLTQDIREFLVGKMAIKEDASIVANELARQGYRSWLKDLASSNKKVRSNAIDQALSL
jgi:hypothetical protein